MSAKDEAERRILGVIRNLPFEAAMNGKCYACVQDREQGHDPDCDIMQMIDDVAGMLKDHAAAAVAEADSADPAERVLEALEMAAQQYGLPAEVESLLRVYESDGTMRYQDEFSRRDITRAEALALLRKEKGDAG